MGQPPSDPGLHRKLVWLSFFRIVTVTVLLGGTAFVSWQTRGEADAVLAPLYGLVILVYAASIAISLALRHGASQRSIALAHIALDVGVAAAVVAVTGRAESVFVFMFSLAVVNGAILLFRTGALIAAALSIAAYLPLVFVGGTARPPAATVFVHGAAFVVTAGLASYLAELLRTTGERLAARESDLAEITALHQTIVESLTSGLLTLDTGGRITFMNGVAEQMTGFSLREVRGRNVKDVVAFEAGTGRDELEYVNRRGERLRLGYTVFPLLGRGGAAMGLAAIFQDLTRLRTMEEAVQRSARLADLGRVAAGLAHELRNPLASMSGSVELLRAQAPADGDERRLLDIVLREAGRLDELVGAFLRFARPPPLRRAPADLAALLAETLRVFANDPAARGVSLEQALRPTPVDCDPDQVRQVAWNLLRNAAQAIATAPARAAGGHIRVSCAPEEAGGRFEVADDGPGIAQADLDRVFLPFHTTKERGTGLGLAIVHRIVDEHGGRIDVRSTPGAGASFVVHLASGPTAARTAG